MEKQESRGEPCTVQTPDKEPAKSSLGYTRKTV